MPDQPFLPLKGPRSAGPRGLLLLGGMLVLGVFAIALSARIDIPMVPVPMSLQTYAVLLIAALAGWRRAGLVLSLYLLAGAAGLPVFADGAAGHQHLMGLTAGYLFGFLLAAMLVGALAERGATATFWRSTSLMAVGHLVILGLGMAWLAVKIGGPTAYESGFRPFLLGGVAKSILVALTISLWRHFGGHGRAGQSRDAG